MKKRILFWCFILLSANSFGQQFMQYNTGSLYDSFENPAQRAFIPDTTRQFAFNFLIPNFSGGGFFTGNTQQGLKTRLFSSYYNTANLKTGENAFNRVNFNYNHYSVMFKAFTSENGDQEVGFFFNTKGELKGVGTDESLSLFNGYTNFPLNSYNDIFNDNFRYQLYHQIGFTYREQISKNLAIGVKISALSGLLYRKVNITQSSVTFDRDNSTAILSAEGNGSVSNTEGRSDFQKYGPSFLNPGAAISAGMIINDDAGFKWQVNVKDLGFIHWNSKSKTGSFGGSYTIEGYTSEDREKNITNGVSNVTTNSQKESSFTSNTNGLLEVSVNKSYWIDNDQQFKFSPTLIGSKELFYQGFTAAFLAPVQTGNYSVALMGSYNDLKLFNMGFQFMVKKENSEFFFGSERLLQTIAFTKSAMYPPPRRQQEVTLGSHSGLDFFIGASFKFGYLIERRLNSSSIPDGETRGFIGRTWDKLFGKKDPNYD